MLKDIIKPILTDKNSKLMKIKTNKKGHGPLQLIQYKQSKKIFKIHDF